VRNIVAHRVHRVMRLVAVKCPVAFDVRDELDGACRADGDIDGGLGSLRALWSIPAVRRDFSETVAVQMDGVVIHREISKGEAHALALLHYPRIRSRPNAGIERENIE